VMENFKIKNKFFLEAGGKREAGGDDKRRNLLIEKHLLLFDLLLPHNCVHMYTMYFTITLYTYMTTMYFTITITVHTMIHMTSEYNITWPTSE
jgi:hypothetical protein